MGGGLSKYRYQKYKNVNIFGVLNQCLFTLSNFLKWRTFKNDSFNQLRKKFCMYIDKAISFYMLIDLKKNVGSEFFLLCRIKVKV